MYDKILSHVLLSTKVLIMVNYEKTSIVSGYFYVNYNVIQSPSLWYEILKRIKHSFTILHSDAPFRYSENWVSARSI